MTLYTSVCELSRIIVLLLLILSSPYRSGGYCFLVSNPLAVFIHGRVKYIHYGSNKWRSVDRPEQNFTDEVSVGAHALQKGRRQQLGARGSLDAAGCRAVEEARSSERGRAPHDYVEPRLFFHRFYFHLSLLRRIIY